MIVLERTVFDHTKALIDFEKGSASVDTLRGDNASELLRVLRCVGDVMSREDLVLDSLVVAASCSPEGSYEVNARLAKARSNAVTDVLLSSGSFDLKRFMKVSCLPENWGQFKLLVSNDTVLGYRARDKVLKAVERLDRDGSMAGPAVFDRVEEDLSQMPEYRYLREKIYPSLRSVSFDFHLHRKGMVKDTVHTTVVDSVYMAGVEALKSLDYKAAVKSLRSYEDYNAALACLSAGYEHTALDILERLDRSDPKVCYLMSVALSRLERYGRALECFEMAVEMAPALRFRANLDPEMSQLVAGFTTSR